MRIIDVSRDLLKAPVYPGDPPPEFSVLSLIDETSDCNMSLLTTTMHAGTHVDAPLHFIEAGETIADLSLDIFIGRCCVRSFDGPYISAEDAYSLAAHGYERVLVRSGGKAYFTVEGARAMVDMGVRLVGTDSQSIGCSSDQKGPHRAFLGSGVPIIEGLYLEDVPDGEYFLIAQPLKICSAEASPVRALLIDDHILWTKM